MSSEALDTQSRPERFGALARLPLFFALENKRAVIAGGSPAATWKAELLAATGARVDVYSGDPCGALLQLAADRCFRAITLHRRSWAVADLPGAALAIGDCGNGEEAARFAAAARSAGVPVNVIDKPAYCDFSFGAIVNRSPLVIGISTGGAAPIFARAVRGKLEALLAKGFARWTVAAAAWRAAVQTSGLSWARRRRFWELFAAHAMANADNEPGQDDFERFIDESRGRGALADGSVTVIDVDVNDPNSLTLHAVRALHAADVIVFDEQIPQPILDFARREARKIRIGKRRGTELDTLMIECHERGARLVRLNSCDRRSLDQVSNRTSLRSAPPLAPDDDFRMAN